MRINWTLWANAGTIITIGGAILGIIWFSISIDERITRLETQVQTLSVAPVITREGGSTVANPILAECAELAQEASHQDYVTRGYTVELMEKLSCGRH